MESYKILIIGGHIRSGTTLLWRICNSHPDVMLTYEFNNFSAVGKPYATYTKKILQRVFLKGFKYDVLRKDNTNRSFLSSIQDSLINDIFILKYLYYLKPVNGLISSRSIKSSLSKITRDVTYIGDKYPHYVFLLDNLMKNEDVVCLIIYRDCRDVVGSTLKKVRTHWKNQKWVHEYDTAEKVAKRWVKSIEIMESHNNNIHAVRYENLINNSHKEISSIGNYLDIEFHADTAGNIRENSIGKYHSYLTDQEIKDINEIAGPTLSRLGYI